MGVGGRTPEEDVVVSNGVRKNVGRREGGGVKDDVCGLGMIEYEEEEGREQYVKKWGRFLVFSWEDTDIKTFRTNRSCFSSSRE